MGFGSLFFLFSNHNNSHRMCLEHSYVVNISILVQQKILKPVLCTDKLQPSRRKKKKKSLQYTVRRMPFSVKPLTQKDDSKAMDMFQP